MEGSVTYSEDSSEQSPRVEHVAAVHAEELARHGQQQTRRHVRGAAYGYDVRYLAL